MEALQTAPNKRGSLMGKEKELGTIQVGKVAGLVMLDANQHRLIFGGKLFTRADLNALLVSVEAIASEEQWFWL